jgi:hypothetical protein
MDNRHESQTNQPVQPDQSPTMSRRQFLRGAALAVPAGIVGAGIGLGFDGLGRALTAPVESPKPGEPGYQKCQELAEKGDPRPCGRIGIEGVAQIVEGLGDAAAAFPVVALGGVGLKQLQSPSFRRPSYTPSSHR